MIGFRCAMRPCTVHEASLAVAIDCRLASPAQVRRSAARQRRGTGCARFAQMLNRTLFLVSSIFLHDSFDSHQRMDRVARETRERVNEDDD